MDDFIQKFPTSARVVAIGDLHGDFEQARKAFQLAGATDKDDKWIGEKLIVVQTGDQIHVAQKMSGNISMREVFRYTKPSAHEIEDFAEGAFES